MDVKEHVGRGSSWKRSQNIWWGTPQDCCLTFTDELEKQLFMKKTVEVGQ